jgi:hypothetical protein
MTAGLPDWYRAVRLAGQKGGQLIPVAVDENGNLYAVIQGSDGVQLRTVKLDSEGQIVAIIKGSGNVPVATDSEGNLQSVIKGFDGTQLRIVKTDSDGNLSAIVYAKLGNVLVPLQMDSLQNLKICIGSQELERILQAPNYGAARWVELSGSIGPGQTLNLATVYGKGIIYGGFIWIANLSNPADLQFGMNLEGNTLWWLTVQNLYDFGIDREGAYFFFLTRYNPNAQQYVIQFTGGITFGNYVAIYAYKNPGSTGYALLEGALIYALRT